MSALLMPFLSKRVFLLTVTSNYSKLLLNFSKITISLFPKLLRCYSFTNGGDGYKGTLKVKAAAGKKILKETKFIGVYCLRYNILFCKVDVAGKLDGVRETNLSI